MTEIINQSFKLMAISATIAAIGGCAVSSGTNDGYEPRDGDIAFQVSESSDFVKAITDVSAQRDSLKFSHVGIVGIGKPCVLEAVPKGGVKITPLETYLTESATVGGKPGVVIKRVNREFPTQQAATRARKYIGQEYDWNFLPDNGKMYCSELVYESFIDTDGTHLFHESPMNFYDADGNIPAYWTELFKKLDADIPQGVSGTSPQEMSRESVLEEVYRYF